ncbi:MAG: alpha-galactosidase [Leptospira sp.]|nr:alpha-galactosidase [Leptospira sp.]
MPDIVFYYKVFDSELVSRIPEHSSEFQGSDCAKFKGKVTDSKDGNSVSIKPILIWIDSLRPPVGFHLETISISLSNLIPTGIGFKIFQHGYQSWSFSASYPPDAKDVSPSLEFLRYSQENIYSHHSGEAGDFISEGFVCLYNPESDSGIIVGVSKLADPGVRFHILMENDGSIKDISIILDYHCSPEWKTNSKISVPEFILNQFKGSPEKAIQNYFQKLSETITIPELVKKTPTGWCSWYYYYTKISEKVILDNLKEVKKKKLPIQFFQVDDGYQRTIGDWLYPNEKFPVGMKVIADEIRREGYEPGIWLAPFLVRKESEFFQQYPEAVLKDEEGEPVPALWNPLWGTDYTYSLDLTHPKSLEFLAKVFKTITKDWGYPYLKLDFLYAGLHPGQVFDPSITPQVRYQNALKLIRKTVGKDTFLLGCGAPIFPSIGFFQGMRISCDVAPFWKPEIKRRLLKDKNALSTEKALINDITRSSMHRIFWLNDPDCLLVRKKKNSMNYNQTLIMATVMAVSGGMLLVSDDMTQLEEDRYDLLLKTIELSKLCQSKTPLPLGIFENEFPEGIYNPAGFLGVWNPTSKPKKIHLKLPAQPKNSSWEDFWTGQVEESAEWENGILTLNLEAYGSRVFSLKS